MKLKYVSLHTALHFAGKNFDLKLDIKKFTGLKLEYDERNEWVAITWNGQVGFIPLTNVACMQEDDSPYVASVKPAGTAPIGKIKAQVSAPNGIKID